MTSVQLTLATAALTAVAIALYVGAVLAYMRWVGR